MLWWCGQWIWACLMLCLIVFFNDTATTEIYTYGHTLSLHDALPIYAREVAGHAAAIAGSGLTARRTVVAADRQQPVLTGGVLLLQNLGSDGEVAVRVEQVARAGVTLQIGRAHV